MGYQYLWEFYSKAQAFRRIDNFNYHSTRSIGTVCVSGGVDILFGELHFF